MHKKDCSALPIGKYSSESGAKKAVRTAVFSAGRKTEDRARGLVGGVTSTLRFLKQAAYMCAA